MTKEIIAVALGILLAATVGFAKPIDPGTIEVFAGSNGVFTSASSAGETTSKFNLNLGVGAGVDLTKYGGDASSVNIGIFYDHAGGDIDSDTFDPTVRLSIYLKQAGATEP